MNGVDLTFAELTFIKKVLEDYPNTLIYGSRVKGSNKKYSDLDVCLKDPITDHEYELLVEKFENSDLQFKIDLSEYCKLPQNIKSVIDKNSILLSDAINKN